jgi:hypothetical protein
MAQLRRLLKTGRVLATIASNPGNWKLYAKEHRDNYCQSAARVSRHLRAHRRQIGGGQMDSRHRHQHPRAEAGADVRPFASRLTPAHDLLARFSLC